MVFDGWMKVVCGALRKVRSTIVWWLEGPHGML